MRVLCIGDVVGRAGCDFLERRLWGIRKLYGADLVIANGENASSGNGLLPQDLHRLIACGVDVVTTGNHIWNRREIYQELDENAALLRPHNYPGTNPGTGVRVYKTHRGDVAVVSLMGLVFVDTLDCPFLTMDKVLAALPPVQSIIVDFHAEATSEKKALALYLDGRVSAVVGTHTHVQTADEQILPLGTGFITDLGMTGPTDSVIGVGKAEVIQKFISRMPARFTEGEGPVELLGVLLELEGRRCTAIERVGIR